MSRTSTRAFRELVSSHDVIKINGTSVDLAYLGEATTLTEPGGIRWVVDGSQLVEFDGKSCAIKGVTWEGDVRTAKWLDVSFENLPPEELDGPESRPYLATIEFPGNPSNIKVHCSACDWWSTADFLEPVEDAVLTPGDPSPAGRCPDCGHLAYVVKSDPEPEFEGFDFSWLAYFPTPQYLPWHVPFDWSAIDYSGLELRIMAAMVGEGKSFADIHLTKPYELAASGETRTTTSRTPSLQQVPKIFSERFKGLFKQSDEDDGQLIETHTP